MNEKYVNEIEAYKLLANEIIIQAVADYKFAQHQIKVNPMNRAAEYEIQKLEKFFRSGWFSTLTSIDGEFLIKQIQKEVRESGKKRNR